MAAYALDNPAFSELAELPPESLPSSFADADRSPLQRVPRLAVALAPASTARLYLAVDGQLELVARCPEDCGDLGEDAEARAAAYAVMMANTGLREEVSDHARDQHLALPLDLPQGQEGALVMSKAPASEWGAEERAALADLAALGAAVLSPFTQATPAASDTIGRNGTGSRQIVPRREARSPWRSARPIAGEAPRPAELFAGAEDAGLAEIIRESIVGSLHLGALRTGDRLPSIRQTARAFSVTPYMVLQAYAELELEGLVERRKRSGIFVAAFEIAPRPKLPETGEWLAEVLTQACVHQVKIPLLPDLIRRWTSNTPVRCVCVESCEDSRYALALELSQQFGMETVAVPLAQAAREISDSDLLIATAYHAADLAPLATEVGIPMLVATVSPAILSAALSHLRRRELTVICVDLEYGMRLRALQGGVYRDRVRVVTVADRSTLASLDRSEPVLLTPAARDRLGRQDFRLIAPMHPSFSLDFARQVSEALVRINLGATRL